MLIPTEQLLKKPTSGSILLIGPSGTGKSFSICGLHRYLRLNNLCTKMVLFDFDGDGSDTILSMARAGRELHSDQPGATKPWVEDLSVYRYTKSRISLGAGDKAGPNRDKGMAEEFIKDFNALEDRLLPGQRGQRQWKPGMELGAIVGDSLTGLCDMYEDFMWVIRNKEIGGIKLNVLNRDGVPADAIDWSDWRLLGEKTMDVYMTAKQLPCFSVFTAHVDLREEEVHKANPTGTGKFYKVPLLTKSLAMRIAKDFGVVLYTTEDFKWETRATTSNRILGAKTRFRDNLPEKCDQDFSKILE